MRSFFTEKIEQNKYLIIIALGIIVGTFYVNFLRLSQNNDIYTYGKYSFLLIDGIEYSPQHMLFEVFIKRAFEMLLFFIFLKTPYTIYYLLYRCFYIGLSVSVAISIAVTCFGFAGLLVFFYSVFTYLFFYFALIFLMIAFYENANHINRKNYVAALIMVFIIEILFEAIISPSILK